MTKLFCDWCESPIQHACTPEFSTVVAHPNMASPRLRVRAAIYSDDGCAANADLCIECAFKLVVALKEKADQLVVEHRNRIAAAKEAGGAK